MGLGRHGIHGAITVAVLALVWVVVRRVAEQSERVSTAREQLDARLARGEIDKEKLIASRSDAELVVRACFDVGPGRGGDGHDEHGSRRLRGRRVRGG